jgi:hypothetical protein
MARYGLESHVKREKRDLSTLSELSGPVLWVLREQVTGRRQLNRRGGSFGAPLDVPVGNRVEHPYGYHAASHDRGEHRRKALR